MSTEHTQNRFILTHPGTTDNLKKDKAPVPGEVKPNELLIRVHALSLNARDIQIAQGKYPPHPLPDNLVPVSDGAGEVVKVGAEVEKFKVGDRVTPIIFQGHHTDADVSYKSLTRGLGGALPGLASEYFVVPETEAVHAPNGWSYEQAATIPIAFATAWSSLYSHHTKLLPGQTVLCLGTGGVSLCAAQLALAAGAKVILTSSSDSKLARAVELLRPLTPKPEVTIQTVNYISIPDWDVKVKELTGGKGVDFVIEIGGLGTLAKSVKSTKQGGLVAISGYLSTYAEIPEEVRSQDLAQAILFSSANVRGVFVANRNHVEDLVQALEASAIQPIIDKVFEFDQLPEAYKYVEANKHFGKVVIKV